MVMGQSLYLFDPPKLRYNSHTIGESPSGKAPGFGPGIRGFESFLPSHISTFESSTPNFELKSPYKTGSNVLFNTLTSGDKACRISKGGLSLMSRDLSLIKRFEPRDWMISFFSVVVPFSKRVLAVLAKLNKDLCKTSNKGGDGDIDKMKDDETSKKGRSKMATVDEIGVEIQLGKAYQ